MKVLAAVLFFVANATTFAQGDFPKCLAKIQARIDTLSPSEKGEFTVGLVREEIRACSFGNLPDVVSDVNKTKAFKRVYELLSDLIDATNGQLSAKGMRDCTRLSVLVINSSDSIKTEANIAKLKETFRKGGIFKSVDFDSVMAQLGDASKFTFDGSTGAFSSKASPVKYAKLQSGSYSTQAGGFGGEVDSISHIFRGHSPNDLNAGGSKSVFDDATKVLWKR